jgi:ankyrin repeat protein
VGAGNEDGNTALHGVQNLKLARMLLEAGADLNAQNTAGVTPLYRAVQKEQLGIVRLLLAAGADRTISTSWGKTPNDIAQENGIDLDALEAERDRAILQQVPGGEAKAKDHQRPDRKM